MWDNPRPGSGQDRSSRLRNAIEHPGGLDAAMRKINQPYEENPMPTGCGTIDKFRLWAASRCRRMGEYSTATRLFTWMVNSLDNRNASLSEGRASPLWCGLCRATRIGQGLARIPKSPTVKHSAAPAPRGPPPMAWRGGARGAGDGARHNSPSHLPFGSLPPQWSLRDVGQRGSDSRGRWLLLGTGSVVNVAGLARPFRQT